MADTLSKLAKPEGATKSKVRIGRGVGSGLGKTAGRGQKGQFARRSTFKPWFEGGQTPIARRLPKRGGQRRVELAASQPQLEEGRVVVRLDLRREHAGGRSPRLAHLPARLEHEHPAAGEGQLPRAGRAYGPATHDDNIVARSHLYSHETF